MPARARTGHAWEYSAKGSEMQTTNLELVELILRLGKLLAVNLLSTQAMIRIFLGVAVSRKARGSMLRALGDVHDGLRDLLGFSCIRFVLSMCLLDYTAEFLLVLRLEKSAKRDVLRTFVR